MSSGQTDAEFVRELIKDSVRSEIDKISATIDTKIVEMNNADVVKTLSLHMASIEGRLSILESLLREMAPKKSTKSGAASKKEKQDDSSSSCPPDDKVDSKADSKVSTKTEDSDSKEPKEPKESKEPKEPKESENVAAKGNILQYFKYLVINDANYRAKYTKMAEEQGWIGEKSISSKYKQNAPKQSDEYYKAIGDVVWKKISEADKKEFRVVYEAAKKLN
jgi:hypothetical protein